MQIYIDTAYRCHAADDGRLRAVECGFFDGKCDAFIEGYRYIPEGESWTREDGRVFAGEMIVPAESYRTLDAAQRNYERKWTQELSDLLSGQMNALDVDDSTALRMRGFYPEWSAGTALAAGDRVRRDGRLWRVIQAHTSQTGWEPENVASLFEQIDETHAGTKEDPIPYSGNMALAKGLHYMQDWEIYLCTRDTGGPVYHLLSELSGQYVEKA